MISSRARDLYERLSAYGERAIDELIQTRESEAFYLDFKRSSDNGGGRRLSSTDRKNLAKAISGFGNSEGGVIVWGIECSESAGQGDVAQAKIPLQDAAAFRARLEGVVSGCTVPSHERVVSHVIPSKGAQGFIVTYIPKSARAPHQTIPDRRYFMRAGSAFAPVPHGVLEGMFGRRPQPRIFPNYVLSVPRVAADSVSVSCGISVYNEGPSIARDVYVVTTVPSAPGPNCTIKFEPADIKHWSGGLAFGVRMSLVSNDDYKIPPETHVQPIIFHMTLSPPFDNDLKVQFLFGCDGSAPCRDEWVVSNANMNETFDAVLNGQLTNHNATERLLGIPPERNRDRERPNLD